MDIEQLNSAWSFLPHLTMKLLTSLTFLYSAIALHHVYTVYSYLNIKTREKSVIFKKMSLCILRVFLAVNLEITGD